MDDLFFTDNNKKNDNNRNGRGRTSHEHFINGSDYEDEFSSDSYDVVSDKPAKQGFSVNIPDDYMTDDNQSIYSQRPVDRTPKGRPVSNPYQTAPENRRPQQMRNPYDGAQDMLSYSGQFRTQTDDTNARRPQGMNNVTPPGNPKRPNYFADEKSSGGKGKKRKKKNKGSVGKKIAATVFALLVICIAGVFAYGYNLLGKITYDTETLKENQYISESELTTDSKVKNILFIGSDYRTGEVTGMRSDTMMLFSIDTANQKLKLTSFLRDSYVYIPTAQRKRKLNAACSSGGAQLVIDTIEYNFKVKIDNYILVDFEAFKKLIDLMGGLDVEGVTAKEAKYLRDKVKITYAKEGKNHFSGAAALWYCRIRYLDDDFHRTERQRKVISAIIQQAKHTNPVTLVKIMQEVLPMISTDISRNELLSLGINGVASYMKYDTEQHQIPAKGTWTSRRVYREGAVLSMDIDENAKLLKDFLYSNSKDSTKNDK